MADPSVPMWLEPGAYLSLQEEMLELERQWREREAAIAEEQAENQAREMELRLATSPIDFVAYELYKRERQKAGQPTYSGPARSNAEIGGMVQGIIGDYPGKRGYTAGQNLGTGEFGVTIPSTQAISRAEGAAISPQEQDILSSFLKAGFKGAGGAQTSYNPEDYWREVEQGWVPTIKTGTARYSY